MPKDWLNVLGIGTLWLGWFSTSIFAQTTATNAWIRAGSGNWEDTFWSTGARPGTNQAIMLTNAGWKAVAIGPATVQNYPETLSIDSLMISSPTDSFNELLLNYAGLATPLLIGQGSEAGPNGYLGRLIVASNATVVALTSAVHIQNILGIANSERGAFSIGGTFNQGEFSQVTAGFLHVGDIGPGVYNLTNGVVSVVSQIMGSNFPAMFNQFGGTNSGGQVVLWRDGEYDLYDGSFSGGIRFRQFSNFKQLGGVASAWTEFFSGNYLLAGGTLFTGELDIPYYPPPPLVPTTDCNFTQTGGTNFCGPIVLRGISAGAYSTMGSYTLSNGVLCASGSIAVYPGSSFKQWNGVSTNAGMAFSGVFVDQQTGPRWATFTLGGGILSTPQLGIYNCGYAQSGGTNQISGTLTFAAEQFTRGTLNLTGGLLTASNISATFNGDGAFLQSGGVVEVSDLFAIWGYVSQIGADPGPGCVVGGGLLLAQNIQIASGAVFHHTGGSVVNKGLLILANGTWDERTAGQQFGGLQLEVSDGTNSTLMLPPGACVARFGESSGISWPADATLTIENWHGSVRGTGMHQIYFGANASSLTAQQVSQIFFHNPAGLSGNYPALLLSTGELVPDRFLGSRRTGGTLVLEWKTGWTLQSATNVAGPYQNVVGATNPYSAPLIEPRRFFRLQE